MAMKAPSPAFSFYPKDLLSDGAVSEMTYEELGVYVTLLCRAWVDGRIPADPVRLQRMLKINHRTFARVWPGISVCWQREGDFLFQSRLEEERAKQIARSEAQRHNATESHKSRRINKTLLPSQSHGRATAEPTPSQPIANPLPEIARAPASFPSASSSAFNGQRPAAGEPRPGAGTPNPLVGDRGKRETECLALVAELAALTGRDPAEVMDEASAYEGAKRRGVNPASLTDDRLLNTVLDLRTNLAAAKAKAAADAKVLAMPPGEPEWQRKERKEQERRARILGTGTSGGAR